MDKLKLMMIDSKMNSYIVELEPWQFKQLNVDLEKVKRHKGKRELHHEIANFIESFKEVKK